MGFNATVVVLTDRLQEIEADPEFGKKLAAAVRYVGSRGPITEWDPKANATGQTQVVCVHHADHQQVVTVGGNCGRVIGFGGGYAAKDDDIIKNLERDRRERNRRAKTGAL